MDPYTDLLWAWNGFWRLSASRPVGMNGPLRVPLSEINAYCELHRFRGPKREEFLFYVEKLDDVFMKYIAEKQEEEERRRQTNAPPPPRTRR